VRCWRDSSSATRRLPILPACIYAPPPFLVTRLLRTGDSPFFSGEENLAPRLIRIFALSHLIDKFASRPPKPTDLICLYSFRTPTFVSAPVYRLSDFSVRFQAFPTNSDTRTAQHTAEPQQDPRPFPAFVTAIAGRPYHCPHKQESRRGLKRSHYTSSPCRCAHRPRHMRP